MKRKLVLLGALVGFVFTTSAQDTFKPSAGMSSLEVTFDPSSVFNANNGGATFALPGIAGLNQGIKYRNWMSESVAARGTFLLGFKNSTMPTQLMNSNGEMVDAKNTSFEWAVQIRPGVETHFSGTNRLSPYVGSELILGFGANSYKEESLHANDAVVESTIKNGTSDFNGNNNNWTYANGFLIGLGAFGGFDYYVAKDLYLGLEINYAFVYNKRNKITTEVAGQEAVETKTGTNLSFAPSAGAILRLGGNF